MKSEVSVNCHSFNFSWRKLIALGWKMMWRPLVYHFLREGESLAGTGADLSYMILRVWWKGKVKFVRSPRDSVRSPGEDYVCVQLSWRNTKIILVPQGICFLSFRLLVNIEKWNLLTNEYKIRFNWEDESEIVGATSSRKAFIKLYLKYTTDIISSTSGWNWLPPQL